MCAQAPDPTGIVDRCLPVHRPQTTLHPKPIGVFPPAARRPVMDSQCWPFVFGSVHRRARSARPRSAPSFPNFSAPQLPSETPPQPPHVPRVGLNQIPQPPGDFTIPSNRPGISSRRSSRSGRHGCLSGVPRDRPSRLCSGMFPVHTFSLGHRFGAVARAGSGRPCCQLGCGNPH